MGIDRAHLAGAEPWWAWTTTMRSAKDAQRDDVDSAHRSPMARSTRTIGTVANGLSLLQSVARGWHVRPDSRSVTSPTRCQRLRRLGFMVHRREFDSRESSRCRRFKKSLDRYPEEPADHALGRSRGGFGSKFLLFGVHRHDGCHWGAPHFADFRPILVQWWIFGQDGLIISYRPASRTAR